MKFTPYNIKTQEFGKSVRGYDKEEVQAFLESLSDEFEALQSENDKLKIEVESYKRQIEEFRKIEKNLQSTLLNAQESTSKTVESAKKQTSLMLKEAELKAVQIVEKARRQADGIQKAVLHLKEEKKLIISRLKAIINTQVSILQMSTESFENESPKIIDSKINKKEKTDINVDEFLEKLL
ncbi:MAG: DivIVA domain-containing protein [Ignavibacteria bacterium]|jgi:cell division initiation protein